jgi:hypothetical protein
MLVKDGVGCCASVRRWVSCHRSNETPVLQAGDPGQDRGIPIMNDDDITYVALLTHKHHTWG